MVLRFLLESISKGLGGGVAQGDVVIQVDAIIEGCVNQTRHLRRSIRFLLHVGFLTDLS